MDKRFGRKLQSNKTTYGYRIIDRENDPGIGDLEQKFEREFTVESYLAHQGKKFVDRFRREFIPVYHESHGLFRRCR